MGRKLFAAILVIATSASAFGPLPAFAITFTTLDYPQTSPPYMGNYALGISGNNIVGTVQGSSSFYSYFYDGGSFSYFNEPVHSGVNVHANAIDGTNIVANYINPASVSHGFVATIPEPASLVPAVFAAVGFLRVARRVAGEVGKDRCQGRSARQVCDVSTGRGGRDPYVVPGNPVADYEIEAAGNAGKSGVSRVFVTFSIYRASTVSALCAEGPGERFNHHSRQVPGPLWP